MLNFLLGIGFMIIILPIIESVIEVFTLLLEKPKAHLSLEIAKINAEIRKYNDDTPPEEDGGFKILGFAPQDLTEEQETFEGEDN